MLVIGQHVTHLAKHRARAPTLAKQPGLTVRAGFMRVVAALLAMPVLVRAGTAVRRRVVIRLRPGHKALVSGPGLKECAVDAEMLADR